MCVCDCKAELKSHKLRAAAREHGALLRNHKIKSFSSFQRRLSAHEEEQLNFFVLACALVSCCCSAMAHTHITYKLSTFFGTGSTNTKCSVLAARISLSFLFEHFFCRFLSLVYFPFLHLPIRSHSDSVISMIFNVPWTLRHLKLMMLATDTGCVLASEQSR